MIDKQLFALIGKNKKYIATTVTLMILSMLTNVGITACICWAVYLLINSTYSALIYPLATILFAVIVRYFLTVATGRVKDMSGRSIKKKLRTDVYNKVLQLGIKDSDSTLAGITQIALEGIEQLDLYYSTYLPQFFYSMIAPIVLFAICVFLHLPTAVVLLACVPLIPLSIVAVSKYAKKIFSKYWGKYTSMGDDFLDSVQGLKELKIFRADEQRHIRMNNSSEEFRKITMKVLVMQLASTTIMDVVAFGGAGVGIAVVIGALAGGVLNPAVALFLVLVSVEYFLPLRALGSAFHIAMNGASAGKKIVALMALQPDKWGSEQANGALQLDNVTFAYDSRPVLKNVSMQFGTKGMTALAGESGCGKSTVVNLLLGMIRADKGAVTMDGINIEEISRKSFYGRIASVSYNTYIFNDTVRTNFMLAKPDVTDEEILNALDRVNLRQFITDNGGLDRVINEDASNISGGQRQRLALAINLVADKDVYILDEATSNIDSESEDIIMNNIKELSHTKCVILITHRLANAVNADKIYFMHDGMVTEQGTHQQLMNQCGGYSKLYSSQLQLEQGYKFKGGKIS